ncbi:hypothetical protein PUN28_004859 [Cardiocondyla obscurior]|uniref:Uncharacterized protein n=1 Tax=Cardiocondyla obscurior TaxID=286306 RepID=A0AAW2GFK1_9HYME
MISCYPRCTLSRECNSSKTMHSRSDPHSSGCNSANRDAVGNVLNHSVTIDVIFTATETVRVKQYFEKSQEAKFALDMDSLSIDINE